MVAFLDAGIDESYVHILHQKQRDKKLNQKSADNDLTAHDCKHNAILLSSQVHSNQGTVNFVENHAQHTAVSHLYCIRQ